MDVQLLHMVRRLTEPPKTRQAGEATDTSAPWVLVWGPSLDPKHGSLAAPTAIRLILLQQ